MKCFVASSAVAATLVVAASAQATVFQSWNLVVTGNLQNNSQDIEGRAFVGGNFTGGSPTVAKNLNAGAFSGITTLAVVGNTTVSNINLQAGNIRRGGSLSGNVNFNGGGNAGIDPTLPSQLSTLSGELSSLSNYLRTLSSNSTAQFPTSQPAPVRYVVNPSVTTTAVFNVSAANVFNNSNIQQIELTPNSATNIVINVSGTTVNFSNGNMVGNWSSPFARSKVIWNFYEATSITLDRNFNGALLAPLAHLTNSTAIDGSVYVASMTQNGEVHLPLYTGLIPSPTAASTLVAAAVFSSRRRRTA